MEFDKSRVYTALNADELKPGSKVILADNLAKLKAYANAGIATTLLGVRAEDENYRFRGYGVEDECEDFALAYLVEPPEEKVLKWTDLEPLDVIKHKRDYDIAVVTRLCDKPLGTDIHVMAGGDWLNDEELEMWEKVEDCDDSEQNRC